MIEKNNETEPDIFTVISTIIAAAMLYPVGLWLRANYADSLNDWYILGVSWVVSLFS